jgi:membrane protein implicated in regulation of membrane protease activity
MNYKGGIAIDPWVIVIIVIFVIAFLAITIIWGIRAHRLRISAGREDLIGKTAEVKATLEPKGIVLVEGERWAAVLETGRAEPGEEVIITRVDGLKLYVTKKQ